MRDISTWCASREWNPVLNDGNTNIVNKNIKCSSNEGNNGNSSNLSFNRDINGISNVRKMEVGSGLIPRARNMTP